MGEYRERLGAFKEVYAFLRKRKKWWLAPIIVSLVVLSFVMLFAETSVFAPIIYTLF